MRRAEGIVCVRECGAKWREINARLRYADVCVIYTFTTVEKNIYISNRSRENIDPRRWSLKFFFYSIP